MPRASRSAKATRAAKETAEETVPETDGVEELKDGGVLEAKVVEETEAAEDAEDEGDGDHTEQNEGNGVEIEAAEGDMPEPVVEAKVEVEEAEDPAKGDDLQVKADQTIVKEEADDEDKSEPVNAKRKFEDVAEEEIQPKRQAVEEATEIPSTNDPGVNNNGNDAAQAEASAAAQAAAVAAQQMQAQAQAQAQAQVQAYPDQGTGTTTTGKAAEHWSINVTGEVTAVIDCPASVVGRIIGKSGETINGLQLRTGARVQIDQSQPMTNGNIRKVTVSGMQTAVQAAVSNVQDLIALGVTPTQNNPPPQGAGDTTENIECPPSMVGRLIGRQGETIKAMQAQSGAFIAIDQNFPDGVNRIVTVRGQPAAVEAAKSLIYDIMQGSQSSLMPAANTKVIDVQQGIVGRIIGRGGETVRKLQQMSGARIQIDQTNWKITVSGADNAVNTASSWIYDIMNGGSPFGGHQQMAGGYGGYQQQYQQAYQQGYYQQAGMGGMMGVADQSMNQQYQQAAAQQMYQMQAQQQQAMGYGMAQGGGQYGVANGSGLPAGWTEAADNEGRPYYVNLTTGVSQWERPQ